MSSSQGCSHEAYPGLRARTRASGQVTTGNTARAVGAPGGGDRRASTAVYCLRPVAPGPREASPSLVYGAALLMRFGLTPIPGSNPGASAAAPSAAVVTTEVHAPVAQRIEHLTTDQKVRGSNPFGRVENTAGHRGRRERGGPLFVSTLGRATHDEGPATEG